MKTGIKVALTLFLLTGSLYSNSTSLHNEIKINTFFDKHEHSQKRVTLAFLIKPVSFSSDLSLDFKKVFFAPKR
jgi:hypothetical protein